MAPKKIALVTDSCADLSRALIEENDIHVIPLRISCADGEFSDGVDISAADVYTRLHAGELPKTSLPTGEDVERVLRTPCGGVFEPLKEIGDAVNAGETVARVDGQPVVSRITGCLRGVLPVGTLVPKAGFKAGDVDARCVREHCFTISDKALAIGGGVLEAVCHWRSEREN